MAPRVSGRMVIDAREAVDRHGYLDTRDVWKHCARVPAGVAVELHIGKARVVTGDAREIAFALSDAGTVAIVGENGPAIGSLYAALAGAFAAEHK